MSVDTQASHVHGFVQQHQQQQHSVTTPSGEVVVVAVPDQVVRTAAPYDKNKCTISDCKELAHGALGLCKPHHNAPPKERARNHRAPGGVCVVQGCSVVVQNARGLLCSKHGGKGLLLLIIIRFVSIRPS